MNRLAKLAPAGRLARSARMPIRHVPKGSSNKPLTANETAAAEVVPLADGPRPHNSRGNGDEKSPARRKSRSATSCPTGCLSDPQRVGQSFALSLTWNVERPETLGHE